MVLEDFRLRCKLCHAVLGENEKPLDHIKKHPVADLFDTVSIPKWE